ncbi:MAG: hypothetical protein NC401_04105 [Ruminococcus sp.]|nr:hypothetical protein [Ruminococcus sp.]
MAKKKQQPKATRFSIQGFDLNHFRATEQYAAMVQALFDRATLLMSQAATRGTIDPDKPFSFDDYPALKAELQKVASQLASQLTTTIEKGSRNQWLFACDKNDGFIDSIMDTSKVSKARLKKMQDRNLDALRTFQDRKVGGMNLSQRVWRYVGQYKEQLESALDVGLGEGRSAQELARDVKKILREPDRLFRRVRDKRGNLVLSKAARAYHPGQGVYRSSVKNAQRLTRSEINMAYRESDFLRWQQLDFVVGFEIKRSNWHDEDGHEYKCKLCDRLQGRYPKSFKFKGWHPQCRCYAVPILMDEETFDENELGDLKAALRGTEYKKKQARNVVTDVPDAFKEWVEENKDTVSGWSSTPYFIQDNFVDGDITKGLKIDLPTVEPDMPTIPTFKATTPQEIKDFILANIADDCTLEIGKNDLDLWNDIVNQLNQRIQQFGLPKFSRIGKPANRQAEASWDGNNNGFNLNIPYLRNQTAIARAEKWKKKGVFYSHTYEDKEDYVRAVIDHEIGHCLLSQFGFKSDAISTMGKAGKSIMLNGKPFNEINDVLGYYASTDVDEYFAEAFAMFAGKNRDKLGEYTRSMMERFVEKVKKKTGQDPFAAPGKSEPKIDPVQAQLDALMPSVEAARKICQEWGIVMQEKRLNEAVAEKDIKTINGCIAAITSIDTKYTTEMSAFFADCTHLIKEMNESGGDFKTIIAELTQYMTNLSKDKKMWSDGASFYQSEIQKAKDKLKQYKASPEASMTASQKSLLSDVRITIRQAEEWGISTTKIKGLMQQFIDHPNFDWRTQPESENYERFLENEYFALEGKITQVRKKMEQFLTEARALIKEADKLGLDTDANRNDLSRYVFALSGSDKAYTWGQFKNEIKKIYNALKVTIDETVKKNEEEAARKSSMEHEATFTGEPHKAVKIDYKTDSEVDATFAEINKDFTVERWFENGDLRLTPTNERGVNGFTYMDGRISLKPDRLRLVKSALGKIGQKKTSEITFAEADAMATFWHEICHNRNTSGNMRLTKMETRFMELANEFVARHSLPEFYAKLGASHVPHPEFQTDRNSTNYNEMVTNYDFVITKLGLSHSKTLASVRKHLFSGAYNDQQTGLGQGLLDGGLKYANGKAVKKSDLNALLKLIRTTESDVRTYDTKQGKFVITKTRQDIIVEWLKEKGFIV